MVIEIAFLKSIIFNFGYFGIFLVSLISSSTLFIPFPIYSILIPLSLALNLNPFLFLISSSLGLALGEMVSYFIGAGSESILRKKIEKNKTYKKLLVYFKKPGFLVVFVFAFLPLPFDIVGILCGILKYDFKKFLISTFLGKFLKISLLYFAGLSIENFIF